MDGTNEVTSSGDGTPAANINQWDLPVVVKETWDNLEPISSRIDSCGMSKTVPHLVIQKKFVKHEDFKNAVASIQKGCCVDSIWHPCSDGISKHAMGLDGSHMDPRIPISFEKFEQIRVKRHLEGQFYIIHNCTPARIISSKQQVEICYPLKLWLISRKNSQTSTETRTLNILNYRYLLLPILFSHAHKLLGTGTCETLTEWKEYLERRNEELKPGLTEASLGFHNGEIVAAYQFSFWDLLLTQDPLIVVDYTSENSCENTCDTFVEDYPFENETWLYIFQ